MQLGDDPLENAECLFAESQSKTNHRILDDLTSQAEQLSKDLHDTTDEELFQNQEPLGETLAVANEALERCRSTRSELRRAHERYKHFRSTWIQIQRRRKFLIGLQKALLEVHQLNNVAQDVVDAKNKGAHDKMSRACLAFEKLNSHGGIRLDDTYICLRDVSEFVSHAVAEAMQTLRTSLRAACKGFHPGEYRNCMRSFDNLGAVSQFSSHVLQVFDEEAAKLYHDADEQGRNTFATVMAFSADMHDLLTHLISVLSFHVRPPDDVEEESEDDERIRIAVKRCFQQKPLPLKRFTELAATIIDEYRFSLISERSTSILAVFESFNYVCDMVITAGDVLLSQQDCGAPFRSKHRRSIKDNTAKDKEGFTLRRAQSQAGLEEISLSSDSSRSERRAWRSDIRRPVSKALKEVANGCLTTSHARHAEELLVITSAPECWVRIQVSESSIRQMLEEILGGTGGRIREALQAKERPSLKSSGVGSEKRMLDTIPSAWTLTTASIAVLRWMSEYVTIGITEPGALSESLSSGTDLFLMFLYSSIDMKSRARTSEADSWFRPLEGMILERPRTKTIGDFIPHDKTRTFNTFFHRYNTSGKSVDVAKHEAQRWGNEHNLTLPHYRYAVGITFSNVFSSHEAIIRQCVAADGIGTLCIVMRKFFECAEDLVKHDQRLSENYQVQRMASLRASLLLGESVQKAFYSLLAWDIIGGWDAVSAIAETYRLFHDPERPEGDVTAAAQSSYIDTMIERIKRSYLESNIPPQAAEEMGMVICSTAMGVLLDGFACVCRMGFVSAVSQALLDIRTLEMTLVELTGIHPCPGRTRTEAFVKATFLNGNDLDAWIEQHRRRLDLHDRHVRALQHGQEDIEVPIVDQIITP